MNRCKVGDAVEILRSECDNVGRQGIVEKEILVYGIPRWQVLGNFCGHDGSRHSYGLFMDMDLRPLREVQAEDAVHASEAHRILADA